MSVEQRWSVTAKRVVVSSIAVLAVLFVVGAADVLRPFVWAAILSYVLLPVVAFVERRLRVRRGIAAALVFVAVLAAIIGGGRALVPLVFVQLRDLERQLPDLVQNAQQRVGEALNVIGLGDLNQVVFTQGTQDLAQQAARLALPVAVALAHFALELLIFLIAVFFLLRDGPKLAAWATSLIPDGQRIEIVPLLAQVNGLLGRYVRGQVILVGIMWTVTTIGLSLLGVPFSIVLGFATGVLELIPIVGPITAGTIATLVALGHPNPFGWSQLAYVAAVAGMYTVLRHAEDYFVIPTVIGRIVRLHPAVVIFALLSGGALFGLLGILLAVPAAATIRLLLLYVGAKLRDEDPFPQLEHELELVAPEVAVEAARAARAVRGEART